MKKLALINQQFIKAAQSNQIDELKNLLDQGADIHANDDEALKWSAEIGNLKVVKFLVLPDLGSVAITHGANIHTDDDYALRLSAYFGHLETVKFLVTQGANIHAKNDEVLKGSSKNGHYDVRQALLAFIQEEKLLVAASVSTSASTWVCGTSASSCLRGMPVLPGASSWVYGTEVASVVLVAATKSVLIQDFLRTKLHQKNNGCQ